jgi:hypothetical protein
MWLKNFSLEHLNFKVFFSRPVLTLLNLQGLDVWAGVIMTAISLFFKCVALTINASLPGTTTRLPGMQTQEHIYAAIFHS